MVTGQKKVLHMATLDFWCHCDLCEAHQQVPSVTESIELPCDFEIVLSAPVIVVLFLFLSRPTCSLCTLHIHI